MVHLGEGAEITAHVTGPRNGKTDCLSQIRVSLAAGGRLDSIDEIIHCDMASFTAIRRLQRRDGVSIRGFLEFTG